MLCHVIIVAGDVLFLTYGDVTQATGGCGSDWVQLNSACYYVSRTSANWSTAQTYCRENGGTLLSSNYQKEPIQILWNMTRENHRWWVEMQNTSTVTAIWKWFDSASNLSNETTPWDRSESTDGEDTRDCAEMDYSGLLNDVQCDSSLPFVCEKRAASNANGCGDTWLLLSGVCYRYFTHTLSSWDAQKSCQDKGSDLLSISSIDEQKKMLSWLKTMNERWWVGLQRTPLRSNTWKWVDSSASFSDHVTPWERGEPNNHHGNDEDCAELSTRGQLNDMPCSYYCGFICEKSADTTTREEEFCGIDWLLFNHGCYKLSTNTRSWSDAREECQTYNADLLSINSLEELEIIRKEIRKTSVRWWVGLRRISPTHSSHVREGKKDEPSKVVSEEDCVVIDSDDVLNVVPCNSSHLALCAKPSRANRVDDCEAGWFLISQNCYKFFTKTMPKSEAQRSCKAEGGSLMLVNTLHNQMEILKKIRVESSRWWVDLQITDPGTSSVRGIREDTAGMCGEITPEGLNYTDCTISRSYICRRDQNTSLSTTTKNFTSAIVILCFILFIDVKLQTSMSMWTVKFHVISEIVYLFPVVVSEKVANANFI